MGNLAQTTGFCSSICLGETEPEVGLSDIAVLSRQRWIGFLSPCVFAGARHGLVTIRLDSIVAITYRISMANISYSPRGNRFRIGELGALNPRPLGSDAQR